MVLNKDRVLTICKEVVTEYPSWQFIKSRKIFVNKVTKDAHLVIDPAFLFRNTDMRFNVSGQVRVLTIHKLVDSVVAKANGIGRIKTPYIIYQQLNAVNLHSLTGGHIAMFVGNHAVSDDLVYQEIHRWIAVAGDYLRNTWPVEDYSALFEVMKDKDFCYRGLWGIGFFCLAATLGKFDFIEQYYAGELKYKKQSPKLNPIEKELLAILPEWQTQWQATGKIVRIGVQQN